MSNNASDDAKVLRGTVNGEAKYCRWDQQIPEEQDAEKRNTQ